MRRRRVAVSARVIYLASTTNKTYAHRPVYTKSKHLLSHLSIAIYANLVHPSRSI